MTKKIKNFIPFLLFLGLLATLSSCNRGMGCPNNFKIGNVVDQTVDVLPVLLIKE